MNTVSTLNSPLTQTRAEIIEDFRRSPETTFFIIGGGVHGAAFARLAALNGHSVVLADRSDYAAGTSSRSSKMLHGGFRYLEQADFAQVYEGIQAREELFVTARHLCHPERFLLPVRKGDRWFHFKVKAGMTLYDWMHGGSSSRHRFVSRNELKDTAFSERTDLEGCFEYTDGVTNDARLTLESILQARQRGARCLNYFEVVSVEKTGERCRIACRDRIDGTEIEFAADVVVNCAGPWAPCINYPGAEALASQIRYSAGAHLLFDRPWKGPSLLLPMSERGRYYFVWPLHGGSVTMVGTTERALQRAEFDPLPTPSEVQEILDRLAKDLPESGLNRETLFSGFSGIRTLPLRGGAKGTAHLSRRHIWKWTNGILTLLGGKLTTANWTVTEGFKEARKRLHFGPAKTSLKGLSYPGSGTEGELNELVTQLTSRGAPPDTAARLAGRYGLRGRFFLSDNRLDLLAPGLCSGEAELAIWEEQAVTAEDLLRRRTDLEFIPKAALSALPAVLPLLSRVRNTREVEEEAQVYCRRQEALQRNLAGIPE